MADISGTGGAHRPNQRRATARLAKALTAKGFEDIAVGRLPDGAVGIRVNNATYNVNTLDGLGVALGVIARQLADAVSATAWS